VQNKKKEVIPDVVKSVVDLHVAAVALIFDAVNLTDYYTAFHKRSAPYQLAIIINGSKENAAQLDDLARYIELMISESDAHIKILNELKTRHYDDEDLNDQYRIYDEIGIPYNIVLDDKALNDGLFDLRNRNTTLCEKIHLSDVANYLIKIFNSG
jgi:glycyl-tRNA synthetase (class II)